MAKADSASIKQILAAVEPYAREPFPFDIPLEQGRRGFLRCRELLRCLPGKRLACIADWCGETVVAKLFIDPQRARVHWEREEKGVRALSARGILTPALLYSGRACEGVFVVLYRFIPEGKSAAAIWDVSASVQRVELVKKLSALLAAHHRAGIEQDDLHLGNFLLADGGIYTLDGDGISATSGPLSPQRARQNFALLLAQLPPAFDRHMQTLMDQYVTAGGALLDRRHTAAMRRLVQEMREGRKRDYLRKIMRDCTAFVCRNTWDSVTVYDRTYDTQAMRGLFSDPDVYLAGGELLKTGNTCTVARVEVEGRSLVLKRYNIKSRSHALNRAFRASRAAVSWKNAHRLLFYDIPTPRPVALIERRWGPVRRSAYYISEFCPGGDCLAFMLDDAIPHDRKWAVAESISDMLKKLYSLKISHGDLKGTNIRISGAGVSLIDLDSMKQHVKEKAFRRAWRRDMRRFFKNWVGIDSLSDLFHEHLARIC